MRNAQCTFSLLRRPLTFLSRLGSNNRHPSPGHNNPLSPARASGLAAGTDRSSSRPAGPFVDVTWLRRNLEGVRVLDARGRINRLHSSAACDQHQQHQHQHQHQHNNNSNQQQHQQQGGTAEGSDASDADGGGGGGGGDPTAAAPSCSHWRLRPPPDACFADYDAYLEGHIPGAVFMNWVRDGARWRPAVRQEGEQQQVQGEVQVQVQVQGEEEGGEVWQQQVLELEDDPGVYVACLEAMGVSAEEPVVVYDVGDDFGGDTKSGTNRSTPVPATPVSAAVINLTAARVWWQLLSYGHPSPFILLGGWAAWRTAYPSASELYEPCPLKLSTQFEAEPQTRYRATVQEFQSVVEAAVAAAAVAAAAAYRNVDGRSSSRGAGGGGGDAAGCGSGGEDDTTLQKPAGVVTPVMAVLLLPEEEQAQEAPSPASRRGSYVIPATTAPPEISLTTPDVTPLVVTQAGQQPVVTTSGRPDPYRYPYRYLCTGLSPLLRSLLLEGSSSSSSSSGGSDGCKGGDGRKANPGGSSSSSSKGGLGGMLA
ncbi:hypothetical protein Agub_g13450, partial [Astrephomene gubernaculifera]